MPLRVRETDRAHRPRILREVREMLERAFGAVLRDRPLEVLARGLELASPEGADPEHVVTLDEGERVVVRLCEQLMAELRRPRELSVTDGRDREAAEHRRARGSAEASRELHGSPVRDLHLLGAVPGACHIRRAECGAELHLELVALTRVRKAVEQRHRAPQERDRVVDREDDVRMLRRPAECLDGLTDETGLLVVHRQACAHRPEIRRVHRQERIGHRRVKMPAACRADPFVCDLPKEIVGEVVPARDLTDDPARPQLVENIEELIVGVARVPQHVDRERPADGRGDLGDASGLVAQPAQPARDHRAHRRREPRHIGRGVAGSDGLHDEQRIALGVPVETFGCGAAELAPREVGREREDVFLGERLERDLGLRPVGEQARSEQRERVVGTDLLGSRRSGDQQARGRFRPDQEVDELERVCVAPLHVVEDEQQRRVDRADRVCESVEDVTTLVPGTDRPWTPETGPRRA